MFQGIVAAGLTQFRAYSTDEVVFLNVSFITSKVTVAFADRNIFLTGNGIASTRKSKPNH